MEAGRRRGASMLTPVAWALDCQVVFRRIYMQSKI